MSQVIAIDFESYFSSKLRYTLKLQIAEQYVKSHLFDCYLVSASDGVSSWSGHPRDFNWSSLENKTLLSHNSYFDRTVYAELVQRNLAPKINYKDWLCTANMSAFLWNRRALDQAVEHALKVKLDKTARANANGKRWPEDFSADEQKTMKDYAAKDAYYCWKLFNDFSSQWPEHERRLSNLTIEQGMRGVQIDTALLDQYLMQTHEILRATENLVPWMRDCEDDEEPWDGFNTKPTSTKCIAEQCRRANIPCCPVKSHKDGEEKYEEWETLYGPSNDWIAALSAWRSVNKLYKTFQTMKERLRPDGTMPFGQRYCGTHTGRISGESKVNLFNQRKQALLCRQDGLMETDDKLVDDAHKFKHKAGAWPEWVKAAIDFRNLIIPRHGYKMITADLSQIEPRVGAWLAGDTEFLSMVSKGFSPYQAHAMLTMGWTGGDLSSEDPNRYALAKARVLSLGYGAGYEKLILMAKSTAGIDLTENDPEFVEVLDQVTGKLTKESGYGQNAKKVVADYRETNPKWTAIWTKLENALRSSIGSDLEITLPSGRVMRYEAVRAETRIEPDKKTGKPRRRTVWTVCIGGKRVVTYGSKIFENLCQALARETHYYGVLKLEDAGLRSLFGVYDEAVLEVALDTKVEDVKRITKQSPEWLPGVPIGVKAKEVSCYQK